MENEQTKIVEPMQSGSIGKLALALSKAQSQMNGVAKGQSNPFFKSKYADLNECIQAAKEPLSANELAVIQTTELSTDNSITIVTILAHSSGEWVKSKLPMKPKKDDDQGRGSSITYGRRYSFAAIVGLAQKDDDGNGSCGNKNGGKAGNARADEDPKAREYLEGVKARIDALVEEPVDAWTAFKDGKELAAARKKLTNIKHMRDELETCVRCVEQAVLEQVKN